MKISPLRSLFVRALAIALPVLAVAGSNSALAVAADQGPTPATARVYKHLLERFDANHDGLVQTSELPPALQQRLGTADVDHDGVITSAELHSFGVARRAARFARADKNGDGKLVPSEVGSVRWGQLKVADADGDGAVTLDEIERAVASGTLRGVSGDDDENGTVGAKACRPRTEP